jgi:hypothetical protein
MAASVSPAESAEPARPASHDALLRTVMTVVTNATVLSALLVYFGWKRSDVQARALGLDETIFGLSTRDYLLRSVDSLFVPLALAAVAGLAWMWADGQLRRRLDHPGWLPVLQRAIAVLKWSWLLLPALAVAALIGLRIGDVTLPLSFGLGTLLTAHAVSFGRDLDRRRGIGDPERTWRTDLNRGLAAVLVLISVFWTITLVADSRGRALADQVEAGIDRRPAVVVHSQRPLGIDAPGVTEERLANDSYRYGGLRLLHHHEGRFLLVHDGWTRHQGVLLVLHDDADLRFEFSRGGGAP